MTAAAAAERAATFRLYMAAAASTPGAVFSVRRSGLTCRHTQTPAAAAPAFWWNPDQHILQQPKPEQDWIKLALSDLETDDAVCASVCDHIQEAVPIGKKLQEKVHFFISMYILFC